VYKHPLLFLISGIQDATAICAHWSSRGHLEPDHLFNLPLFHQAMKVYDRHDKLVGFESFLSMLKCVMAEY
jgi:hypothetical protein